MTSTFCEEMDAPEATRLMQRPLESKDFNRVSRWLRSVEGEERVEFLNIHFDHTASYRLAISVLNNRSEAFDILQHGLDAITKPHSQLTKMIAQFGVTKLGSRRTIGEIASRIESQPHVVDMALYWLPRLLPKDDPGRAALKELQQHAEESGVIKPPKRTVHSDGTVTYSDVYGQ